MVIQTSIGSYANCSKKENLKVPFPQQLIRRTTHTSLSGGIFKLERCGLEATAPVKP
jgi:hypothetical protein